MEATEALGIDVFKDIMDGVAIGEIFQELEHEGAGLSSQRSGGAAVILVVELLE